MNKGLLVGTSSYMSPEMFNCPNINDLNLEKIDVFACGIVLFSMVMGFPPIMKKATGND